MLRALLVVLITGVSLQAAQSQRDAAFPHTKSIGRATVQYQHERMNALAIYDYSQRNHDTPWLLVQVGVAMEDRGVVRRRQFSLVAPDGQTLALASEESFVEDGARLQQFFQNARIFRRDVRDYFPKSASGDALRFFASPGQGVVSDEAVVPASHGVVIGDLYFKSSSGSWSSGMYRLVVDHEQGRAELPIRLE